MFLLWYTVLQQEKSRDKYEISDEGDGFSSNVATSSGPLTITRRQSRIIKRNKNYANKVAIQAMLYVGCYTITWIFDAIRAILFWSGGSVPQWLHSISFIFIPMQGLFNALVYLRPRIIQKYRDNKQKSSTSGNKAGNDSGSGSITNSKSGYFSSTFFLPKPKQKQQQEQQQLEEEEDNGTKDELDNTHSNATGELQL